MGAMTLFAVSCYDDSALWGEVDRLDGRIDSLASALNSQVEAINSKIGAVEEAYKAADADILAKLQAGDAELAASLTALTAKLDGVDGKVDGYIESNDAALKAAAEQYQKALKDLEGKLTDADKALAAADADILVKLASVGIVKVEKKNGNAVLTFTDGTTLEVPAQPETGIVTVVEVEGVKYWAVVVNGEAKSLEVPVGHNDLQFQVSDSEELEFSVDGGTTWTGTGAYVSTSQQVKIDFYQGQTGEMDEETYEYLKEDFYTLVFGEETYYLPLYKVDNSVVTLKAGKTYFKYEETQTIEVAVADITNMYVMTKPDGWRAKLDGKKLTVTSPAEANVLAGTAEADGEVLLHCTTVEGNCKIAKLAVATTSGFSLTVDAEGNVKIVNPIVVTNTNMWGEEMTDFNDACVGLASIADFEADPLTYIENVQDDESALFIYLNNWKMNTAEMDEDWNAIYTIGGEYTPGVYEVDVIETTVAKMYSDWSYGNEMPRGSQFVVWACPVDSKGQPEIDALVYGYYAPIDIEAEELEVSFNEITVSVALYGAKEYIVGKVNAEYTFNYYTGDYDINYYITEGLNGLAYGYNNLGMTVTESGEYEYALSEVVNDMEESAPLSPSAKYFFYIIPVIDGKDWSEYTAADAIVYEYTTEALEAGGSASVEFVESDATSFTELVIDIKGSEGTSMIYYNFFDGDATYTVDDLIAEGYVTNASSTTARDQYLEPGTTRILAAVAVDSEGKYGELVEQDFTTPEIVYSETFIAKIGTPTITSTEKWGSTYYSASIPVTVEGGTAAKYYYYFNTTVRDEEYLKDLPLGSHPFSTATVLGEMSCSTFYAPYQFAVVVESTEGEFSAPVWIMLEKPAAE